jgi:uncharacterized membrane protein YqjE
MREAPSAHSPPPARLSAVRGRSAVRVTVLIVVAIVSGAAALLLFTDLHVFLVGAVCVAPLVVLIPYAYSPAERRDYGIWTVVAALVLPAVATTWVIWLVLARGVIGRHP